MAKKKKSPARKSTKRKNSSKSTNPTDYILGFDSEWVDRDGKNHILSYQWHMITPNGAANGLFLTKDLKKPRMSLPEFLGKSLEAAKSAGLFAQYPTAVTLVAHFSLADLNAFDDFHDAIKAAFDNVRKTYVSLGDPETVTITDSNNHQRKIEVTLRDSKLIAPSGSKLEDIGVLHGVQKIQLPAGMIEQMDVLLKKDPQLFERYAVRDAEVTALHAQKMSEKAEELAGKRKVPISLGGMAIDYCLKEWEDSGISILDVLGREEVIRRVWDEKKRRYIKKKEYPYVRDVHENIDFVTECYHGGRNEAFMFGASEEDDWRDIDLVGAYSTAMATVGMLDWDNIKETTDINDFAPDAVGYARVSFEFPPDVRYPGLPVRMPNNLIFPRMGEAYVTAPEIAVALEQGCKIEIQKGRVVPMSTSVKPVFEVVKRATEGRNAAKKAGDVLEDKLYKELINSFYGKFAQGLRKKRIFSTTTGETEDMEPSRVTQAFIAAHVTGLVRAILSEVMNAIPDAYQIISVTTDGFITNAPEDVTDAASDGAICSIFKQCRTELGGNDIILEDKHQVRQVLCWRTRGQATLKKAKGHPSMLAKAGLKAPYGLDTDGQNKWIVDNFVQRTPETKFTYERLRGLRSIYDDGGDLISEEHAQRLNMDFDFKRRVEPYKIWMRPVDGHDHLAFQTLPWMTKEDYEHCRDVRSGFIDEAQRCLKTKEDLKALTDMVEGRKNLPTGVNRSGKGGKGGSIHDAVRMVVRAMVHDQWGLSLGGKSYAYWVKVFKDWQYDVTDNMFKKAKSRDGAAPDHSVELNADVLGLQTRLRKYFQGFDHNAMLARHPQVNDGS